MTLSTFAKKWRDAIPSESFAPMVEDLQAMFRPPEDGNLFVESTVSNRDGRPLVSVKFGKYDFQMDIPQAREVGSWIIQAAHAAELDAYCYQYFGGEMHVPIDQVGQMVAHFREWREKNAAINRAVPSRAQQ